MDKRVSVVMTTYNGQKYLREQMDSLREQTMPIDEVIIMDDCSTDHTPDLVSAYIKEYNLKGWNLVQNELNQGWKKNFKSGFDLATGGYIFPCDQDDIWHPDKVEKMVGCMENNPKIELLAANYNTFFSEKDNGSGSKLYASNSKKMKKDESIDLLGIDPKWPYINRPGCVFCFTKTFYNSIKDKWNTKYPHDAILWRFARMDHALGLFNYPVIEFRRHGDNATSEENRTKESRKERLEEHITEMKKPFALVQVIPATFRSDCVPMYDLYREGKLNFDDLFNGMIYDRAVPNVDGVYFPDYSEQRNFEQLQIFNTGAVELKMDFEIREQNSRSQQLKTERYLIIFDFEAELRKLIQGTSKMYQKLGRSTAMYVCVTIVGCKGLWNYTVNAYGANAPTKVDRNQIVCTPIEIRNIQDDVQVKEGIENCIRMTKYSLGIRI